jgi:endonuclease YncB( thermonuclease family)
MTDSLPNVGRPKGNAWRNLQDEGIVWEGQVLITGEQADLAALLIVTNVRLAFVRGGAVALDIPRDWLEPAPILRRTGTVQLWVSSQRGGPPESLTFIARDGRDEAAVLLSLIGDHGAYGSAYRLPTYIPDDVPPPPEVPLARSRRRQPRHAEERHDPFESHTALPVFSILDDDDFPSIGTTPSSRSGWGPQDGQGHEDSLLALAAPPRNPNEPLRPIEGFDSRDERAQRAWVVRVIGLAIVVGFVGLILSGILPSLGEIRDFVEDPEPTVVTVARVDDPTPTPTQEPAAPQDQEDAGEQVQEQAPAPTPTLTPDIAVGGPSSSEPQEPTVVPAETAIALGIGSDQPTETTEPASEADEGSEPEVALAQATDEPAEQVEETPVIPPPSEEATEPADTPTGEATLDESPEPENGSSVVQTETTEPETAVASGALPEQDATLGGNEIPNQAFAMGGMRMQIAAAYRAESLPDLTLGRNAAGEWVVLLLEGVNWSDQPQNLEMASFRLAPASDLAAEIPLDATTGAVASYLDLSPMLRATESGVVAPGGYQPVALVFGVPAGLGDLVLLAGNQNIALDQAFANQTGGSLAGPSAVTIELVPGTVVEVVDGQTLVVDAEGDAVTVRHYGLASLTGDTCYAPEAEEAHAELVVGQTLLFERERRNRSESTVYLRDAWLVSESGELRLVAAVLAGEGAALPETSEPDIRFAGWIAGSALLAEQNGAGIWSACSPPAADTQ